MSELSKTKVLVTGITGFIGSHTAIQLLNKGYQVRGSMRKLTRASQIKEVLAKHAPVDKLEFVKAELTSLEDWDNATKGVDYVIHIASPVPRKLPKNDQELIIPAKAGAINVLKSAEKNGVKRVVMTSSAASIAYGTKPKARIYTEEDWTDFTKLRDTTAYIRSKTIAELTAWDYVKTQQAKVELSVINPVLVLGPVLEEDFGTSALLIKKLLGGEVPGMPKFGFCLVDVRDVADLHIRAMTHPEAAGKRFICSEKFEWITDIVSILKKEYPTYQKPLPSMSFPNFLVRIFSLIDTETKAVLVDLDVKRDLSNNLAKTLLGWQPRSNEEAIKATADSLIELGIV